MRDINVETPLSQAEFKCRNCGQVIPDWDNWFCGPCPSDQATGHDLPWEQIKLLKFRTKQEAK